MAGYAGAMHCPVCSVTDTRVIDSRPAEGGEAVRRRRECENCGHRFTTYERLEPTLMVRKRDGTLEPFSGRKLAAGLSAALAERPVSGSEVERVVALMEETLIAAGPQITSEEIGHEVLEQLKELDEVAYLRFASVYKDFQDAADFSREMAELDSADQ